MQSYDGRFISRRKGVCCYDDRTKYFQIKNYARPPKKNNLKNQEEMKKNQEEFKTQPKLILANQEKMFAIKKSL